jgi:ABC-type Mn2+/Zn2+ transport system permease subunit
MSFAVHGTAELAFTGAAAGLIVADNPVAGALAGSLVVAALIAALGARPRERDSAIGAILAFGLGIGVLLLGFYQGFATAATNILFGNIFGVSGSQLLILVQSQGRVYARRVPELAGAGMPRSDEPSGQLDTHVPSGLGWPAAWPAA